LYCWHVVFSAVGPCIPCGQPLGCETQDPSDLGVGIEMLRVCAPMSSSGPPSWILGLHKPSHPSKTSYTVADHWGAVGVALAHLPPHVNLPQELMLRNLMGAGMRFNPSMESTRLLRFR
jgi:hypothetical protein